MTPTVILLADGLGAGWSHAHLAEAHASLARCFLHDSIALVQGLRNTRLVLRHGPRLPPEALVGLPPTVATEPIRGDSALHVADALADALAEGDPAVLIGPVTPHLPLWRLRDAFTHLSLGADAVIGPGSAGGWYLLGLRKPDGDLLRSLPGRWAAPKALFAQARAARRRLVSLPPWFELQSPEDLPALGEVLRSMPQACAAQTRALLDGRLSQERAVGG